MINNEVYINEINQNIKKAILNINNDEVSLICDPNFDEKIKQIALNLRPWRKGPFRINDLFIDSEWRSYIKFNILKPHLKCIKDKIVADIGCNNGYYMFKMLEFQPKKIIGFDPSMRSMLQFKLINSIAKTPIKYERMGIDDLINYEFKFDIIFCLGVLYHRIDPIKCLQNLKNSLNKNGLCFIDTLYIESKKDIALIPNKTYSKISNIYFIPSISALKNISQRAGFDNFKLIATKTTDIFEQRSTKWSTGYSLANFLDPKDPSLTCEGYPAPKRAYAILY